MNHIYGISYKNIWAEADRTDGYASVHVRMGIGYEDEAGKMHRLASEIQLHFKSFFDGTHLCTKELMHIFLDYEREIDAGLKIERYNKQFADAASMLQILLFMKTLTPVPTEDMTAQFGNIVPTKKNFSVNQATLSILAKVARRSPLKHVLVKFLTTSDYARLSSSCSQFKRVLETPYSARPDTQRASESQHNTIRPRDVSNITKTRLLKKPIKTIGKERGQASRLAGPQASQGEGIQTENNTETNKQVRRFKTVKATPWTDDDKINCVLVIIILASFIFTPPDDKWFFSSKITYTGKEKNTTCAVVLCSLAKGLIYMSRRLGQCRQSGD